MTTTSRKPRLDSVAPASARAPWGANHVLPRCLPARRQAASPHAGSKDLIIRVFLV